MTASIIIPHYRDMERLDRCLHGLAPQVSGLDVIVVDNDSGLDFTAMKAAHPWARFVTEPEKGAAAARNRGVRETTSDTLLFIDADCVPAPDWVAQSLAALPKGDVVSGRVDTFDEGSGPRTGAQAFETVFAFRQKDYIEKQGFAVTANLATTRRIFEAVGDFRVGLSEDKDWCQRAVRAGFTLVYVDAMAVSHPTRSDWPALRKKWLRLTEESFALHLADGGSRGSWGLRAAAVLLSAVPHSVKVWASPKLGGAGERLRGMGTLFRQRIVRAGWMVRQSVSQGQPA
jgi:GT2 family glycosyltransferase